MTSNIYITASTSLVLLKNLSTPVVIYLSSLQVSNFFVTIRDTTGRASIQQTPVRISTIGGALFEDGTTNYNLDQPYGLVNLSLQNSNIWHFRHTSGQKPATAAATAVTVRTNSSYFSLLSSINKITSTLVVQEIDVLNPLIFTGDATFYSISVASSLVTLSSAIAYGNMDSFGPIIVNKEVSFISSLITPYVSTFQKNVYVFSSISSGGNLYVGGTTYVTSSLQLASTVQVNTLQVTTSTATAIIHVSSQVAGLFSTLGSVASLNDITIQRTAFVGTTLSTQGSLYGSSNLIVGFSSIFLSTTSLTFASFFSTTTLQNVSVMSSITFHSTASFRDSTMTTSFQTSSLFSFSNLQLQGFSQFSSLTVQSTISTLFLQAPSSVTIAGSFFSISSISTLSSVSVADATSIIGNATFSYLSIGKDLIVGGSTFIGSSISTGSGIMSMNLTASSIEIKGPATIGGNVYVSSATLLGQLVVGQDTTLFGLHNNPFIFSTLTATSFVSTPQLTVSALLSTGYTYITKQNYMINTSSIYTSTLTTPQISTVNSIVVESMTGNTLTVTPSPVSLTQNPYNFLISSSTYFTQGVSSMVLSTGILTASTVRGAFFGDATSVTNITNTFIPYLYSFSTVITSSFSTLSMYTSSFTLQALQTSTLNFYSSLTTRLFRLDPPGSPILSTVHQFVTTTPSNLVINNVLYLNTNSSILISPIFRNPAKYNLDISGLLYVTGIQYSSIQVLDVNQLSNNSVTGYTSSLLVTSLLKANNLEFVTGPSTFLIQTIINPASNNFDSIQATTSSLIIENQLSIQNELFYSNQKMIIDPTQALSNTTTSLTTSGFLLMSTLKTSSLTIGQQMSTPNLFFSTLAIYNGNAYQETKVRNSFQSYPTTLNINSTLILHNTYNVLGINTAPDPSTFMRVSSNAYFSTLWAYDLRAGSITYSFQTL